MAIVKPIKDRAVVRKCLDQDVDHSTLQRAQKLIKRFAPYNGTVLEQMHLDAFIRQKISTCGIDETCSPNTESGALTSRTCI